MNNGNPLGRRKDIHRVPKAELVDICKRLHECGIGSHMQAALLGYSGDYMRQMLKISGLPRLDKHAFRRRLVDTLPSDLKSAVNKIATRSAVFRESAHNRIAKTRAVTLHKLIDE